MDETQFDRLAKNFGLPRTRRGALAGLTALGVAHLGLAGDGAEAGGKGPKKKKKKDKRCTRKNRNLRRCRKGECETDGDCFEGEVCDPEDQVCDACLNGTVGCEGKCLDLSVCPADGKHIPCNNSPGCMCTRIADNNNTRFCAVAATCDIHCGPNNSCPGNHACVTTCCDGPGNAGLRCLPSCG